MASQGIKIGLSIAIIVACGTYLLVDSVTGSESLEYYHPADVVIVNGPSLEGQRIRMSAEVVEGSIFRKKGTLDYRFEVKPIPEMVKHPEAKDKTISVQYTGVVPDTFQPKAEVVVSGTLNENGTFVAKELIAKCPSKYEAERSSRPR